MRNGENKSYRFVPFLPDAKQIMPKENAKKLKKIKKYHYGIISSKNGSELVKKERK